MAEPNRQTSDSIAGEIAAKPYSFDFCRAVRMLEAEFRDRPRVGNSVRLEEDLLRFCQIPSLSFAPSTLEGVQQPEGSRVIRMFVNFLGLFGPNGPLPQHLTDFARDRYRNAHDRTLVRFMDIFHHRMLSFFYRAWAINQKSVDLIARTNLAMPITLEASLALECLAYGNETQHLIARKSFSRAG